MALSVFHFYFSCAIRYQPFILFDFCALQFSHYIFLYRERERETIFVLGLPLFYIILLSHSVKPDFLHSIQTKCSASDWLLVWNKTQSNTHTMCVLFSLHYACLFVLYNVLLHTQKKVQNQNQTDFNSKKAVYVFPLFHAKAHTYCHSGGDSR